MEIARLQAVITAKTDQFEREMQKVDATGQRAAQSVEQNASKIEAAFSENVKAIEEATRAQASFTAAAKRAGEGSESIGKAGRQARKGAADFNALERQIQSSFRTVSSLGAAGIDELRDSFASASGEAAGLAGSLGIVGVAVGVTLGALAASAAITAGFINMAREGSDLAGAMLDLSLSTGISTEKLGLFKIAAEQSGAKVEDFARGIEETQKRLQEAASGNEKLSRVFTALGVNAKTAAEDPQRAFETLATTIAGIEDPLLRAKAASEVFGSSGANLISSFITLKNDGQELQKRMRELGLTMSGEVAKSADRVGDEFVILGAVADSLKVKVASELAPALVVGLQSIENSLVKMQPFIVAVGANFIQQLTPVVAMLDLVAGGIDKVFGSAKKLPDAAPSAGSPGRAGLIAKGPAGGPDPNQKLRDALAYRKPRAARATPEPITPADTAGSFKQAADAKVALEEAFARRSLEITKGLAASELAVIKDHLGERLISFGDYYDRRRAIEQAAIDVEIANQQRVASVERKRIVEAELAAQTTANRAKKISAEKLDRAKTPQQRRAIEEDRANRLIIIENELQATRDKHAAKIIETEGKIGALKQKRAEQTAAAGREEVKANRAIEASFRDLNIELLRATGRDFEATAAELGGIFADTLALAIREGRPDIIAAIRALTEIEINKARSAESAKRLDVKESGLALRQAEIQNDLNRGIISEVTARRRQVAAQQEFRAKILEELEYTKQLAVARGDAAAAARIAVEIEKTRGLGEEIDPHLKNLQDSLTRDFDDLERALVSGTESVTDALRNFTRSLINDVLREIQGSLVEGLTGEKTIGAFLGKKLAGLFSGILSRAQGSPGASAAQTDAQQIAGGIEENARKVAEAISDTSSKTADVIAVAQRAQTTLLQQIASNTARMAACGCPPEITQTGGHPLLNSILQAGLGIASGAIAGGLGGGGGESGSGYSGAPAGGYFTGAHGVPLRIKGKAMGGDVMAGQPYFIGEEGPELFVPKASGLIVPTGQTRQMMQWPGGEQPPGKAITVINNFTIQAPAGSVAPQTQRQIAAQTGMAIEAAMRRNG